ncbi:hypothetical protein K6Y31_20795 [Motilimonas cestriensis]|uniref:DUF2570 domain-containing protein n=1 Tax=Motilimonas cestriensis TaxID=2742685 RepID=A0ABS8WHH7_9GAMM|nr:hypothetical protein [Motilimonas cestriensis]MCE2597216.1 hypothetical protein [Motilimonas cestriensis]
MLVMSVLAKYGLMALGALLVASAALNVGQAVKAKLRAAKLADAQAEIAELRHGLDLAVMANKASEKAVMDLQQQVVYVQQSNDLLVSKFSSINATARDVSSVVKEGLQDEAEQSCSNRPLPFSVVSGMQHYQDADQVQNH